MKVLHIIPTFSPILGGAELAVLNIVKNLNEAGINSDVLTFNITKVRWKTKLRTEVVYIQGIKVIRIGGFNLLSILNSTGYRSFLLTKLGVQILPDIKLFNIVKSYDVLHYNDEVNLSIPFFLSLFNKGSKTVFHLRTFDQLYRYFLRSKMLVSVLNRVSDNFIIESEKYIEMLSNIGISNKRLFLWSKGVDTFRFNKKEGVIARDSSIFRILFVGRFNDKRKNFRMIIEALKEFNYHLEVFIVTPSSRVDIYYTELLKDMNEVESRGYVVFKFFENVEQSHMPGLYNSADIFVFTPTHDSMPNVLLEASACKLPIISTNVGGIPSILRDGENAILIEADDIKALKESIIKLISDVDLRLRLGSEARKNVLTHFEYSASIAKLLNIYKEL